MEYRKEWKSKWSLWLERYLMNGSSSMNCIVMDTCWVKIMEWLNIWNRGMIVMGSSWMRRSYYVSRGWNRMNRIGLRI